MLSILFLEIIVRLTPLPWILEPSFSQIGSLRSVDKEFQEKEPLIVFYGNSLMRDAISPKIVAAKTKYEDHEVVNAGLSAGNFFIDYKFLTKSRKTPTTVVLQIDLNRFLNNNLTDSFYFKKLSTSEDLRFLLNTENYFTVIKHVAFKAVSSSDIWHRFIFNRNESENVGSIIKKDYLGQFEIYGDLEKLNGGTFDLKDYIDSPKKIKQTTNFRYFKEICKFSKNNNVNLVLLHLPINYEEMDKYLAFEIQEFFNFLQNECPGHTAIINNLEFKFNTNNSFIDYGHLSNKGAEEYSEVITETLISYIDK